jgi:multicomponent Na+:H+ antiporter subunit G
MIIIGWIFLSIAMIFILFGVISIFVFKNLYMRIIASTIIDTVGSFLFLIGLMFLLWDGAFIFRILLLIGFIFLTSPISTHVNIRSAYLSKLPMDHDQRKSV